MSSADKNLSVFENEAIPDASAMRFGIVVAEWNHAITESLYNGAHDALIKYGVTADNIKRMNVPGSFELTSGARLFAEDNQTDAVICLGCVIQGETRHFDFICMAVANGLTQLNMLFSKPFIFGVLTTQNLRQAMERSGGKHGNKGMEAAVSAIKMLAEKKRMHEMHQMKRKKAGF
jgi:6,7-dimethyl-8-ribityllumazine synthase